MRHARAASPDRDDHGRALLEEGRRDAREIVARSAVRAEPPDVLLTSTARRTVETAEIVREGLGLAAETVREDARLYLASLDALLALVAERHSRGVRHLMIVGHNPGLEELASHLEGDGRRRHDRGFPTAALRRYALGTASGVDDARLLFETHP